MKNINMINGLQELDVREQSEINGGESFWYNAGLLVGSAKRFLDGFLANPPSLPSAVDYK